ncbi:hypothetical protein JCM10212_000572 [Sporobolomyces blumeae]
MDIPSAYNSPLNSHPPTPLASQPGTTNPSPSTSVSVSHSLLASHRAHSAYVHSHHLHLSNKRIAAAAVADRTRRALDGIRGFLESKSCYDILPESFRLIVLDNKLAITKSLQALITNGVVSAPLYDSTTQRFAGMFTLADVVHLIQYYYLTANEYDNVVAEVEAFQLGSLRKIEQAIDVPPPPTISVHPDQPLSDACAALVRTHARRLPLVDRDDQTGKETIVSVLTQYRVLKFIAINCAHDCARLDQSIGSLGIGTYAAWYEPPPHRKSSTTSTDPTSPVSPDSPPTTTVGSAPTSESAMRSPESALADEGNGNGELPDVPKRKGSGDRDGDKETDQGGAGDNERDETEGDGDESRTSRGNESGMDTPTTARRPEFPRVDSRTTTARGASYSRHEGESDEGRSAEGPEVEAGEGDAVPRPSTMGVSDRFFPLSTATMKTSVFDVVHVFSERGISAVPIVDEDGIVLNMYETVDIVDLVRQNAYQVLDSTIEDAINQRSPDFTGVMTCTPADTLSSVLTYVRERRCHRFVIVEPDDVPAGPDGRPARKKGSLIGILSLSDMLRFLVGHENLKGMEVPGLGVHGLRGVSTASNKANASSSDSAHPHHASGAETDLDFMTDAASSVAGSKMGSRRGSEATDSSFSWAAEAGSASGHGGSERGGATGALGTSSLVVQPSASVPGPGEGGLEDVIEGEAVP